LEKDAELTLGERVHLTQKKIIPILNNTYVALGIGITIMVLVLLIGVPSVQFIESFGVWEDRLNTPDGRPCNPDDIFDRTTYPAIVNRIEGTGADEAGIQYGDIITKINELEIPSTYSLDGWPEKLPLVKPGDTVAVMIERSGQQFPISVKTSPHFDDPSRPMLGVNFVEPVCSVYFILNEEFSQENLELVLLAIWLIIIIVAALGACLIIGFVVWRKKINNLKHEVEEWEGEYIDEAYLLAVETNVPTGNTDGEKIFNMVQTVFPELRKDYSTFAKWDGKMKLHDGYEFDCYQATWGETRQLYIAKHFGDETITLEKLQELCNKAEQSLGDVNVHRKIEDIDDTETMRVVCVGRKYDPKFLKDKSQDKLMDELDVENILIDLILEEDGKYSMLRTEYEISH